MTVTLLYFASLAEALGQQQETLALPGAVVTAGKLRTHLSSRGGQWAALARDDIRVAVNHHICKADHAIAAGDEIAFFPPVTGG